MLTACDSQAVTMATLPPAHGDPLYFLKVANKNNVCFSPHGKDPESVCVTWPALTFIYTHTHIPVHHLCLTCTHTHVQFENISRNINTRAESFCLPLFNFHYLTPSSNAARQL